jgi:hypothetical protein
MVSSQVPLAFKTLNLRTFMLAITSLSTILQVSVSVYCI